MNEYYYDRDKAIEYAHKWAYSRNSRYLDFENIGGDCTNFVSQVIFAGTQTMNYTPVYGWFYIDSHRRSASWTGVEFLEDFLLSNKSKGPFAQEVSIDKVEKGDVVQISFDGNIFKHSAVVVEVGYKPNEKNILLASHSIDSDYKQLSIYENAKCRFLHILGFRR